MVDKTVLVGRTVGSDAFYEDINSIDCEKTKTSYNVFKSMKANPRMYKDTDDCFFIVVTLMHQQFAYYPLTFKWCRWCDHSKVRRHENSSGLADFLEIAQRGCR